MKTQLNNKLSAQLETLLLGEASSENAIYGLEYIADEFYDGTNTTKSQRNEQTTLDWFGLSDLCI